ncbi:hypothetical protein [Streptomyces sp. NPDC090445]|uniref:hypothetical protein n=1 Tax=Streptomyces sp. NPDC090445 TaxID=3365963 RepID=UPI00381B11A9
MAQHDDGRRIAFLVGHRAEPLADAIAAAADGRFLLPAGPLALMLADRSAHLP